MTGAGGFVGYALSESLTAARHSVLALVRSSGAAPGSEPVRISDITNSASLVEAMRGVDSVVHLAGRAHVVEGNWSDAADVFRRVNIDGTRAVIEAAQRAGVGRLVFVSSVKAVAEASGPEGINEQTEPEPRDGYGRSKLEAERVVLEAVGKGLDATILRLPLVYGPRMKGNMMRLFSLIDRGVPLPFGFARNARTIVFVGNVVAAITTVLSGPRTPSRVYFVGDDPPLSTAGLVMVIADALDKKPRLVRVPPVVLRGLGRAGDVIGNVLPVPISSESMQRLLGTLIVDSSRLRRELYFTAPYGLHAGMGMTAAWFRNASRAS